MNNKHDYLALRSNSTFIEEVKQRNYREISKERIQEIIEDIKSFESLTQNKNKILLLTCINKAKIYYISDNIKDNLGYEKKELLQDNGRGLFKIHHPSNLNFPITVIKWSSKVKLESNAIKNDVELYVGGIKFQHKTGELFHYFAQVVSLDHPNKPKSEDSLSLSFLEDISHLVKGDISWAYFRVVKEEEYKRFFSTETGDKGLPDILTKREKELLEQINLGKSTKEISTLLNISVNTVERHRKNMNAKLGAKDTTALLQLCKMCGVL